MCLILNWRWCLRSDVLNTFGWRLYMTQFFQLALGMTLPDANVVINFVFQIWGEFDFDENVQPASLSTTHETPLGDAIVCGWGHYVQKPKKRSSRDLLKVKMTVVNPSKCVSAWSKFNVDYNICAESPVSTGTCNGDSGGPLIIGNTVHGNIVCTRFEKVLRTCSFHNWRIVFDEIFEGLLSYGHGKCGNGVPEVYTSVGVFYKWIQGIAGL